MVTPTDLLKRWFPNTFPVFMPPVDNDGEINIEELRNAFDERITKKTLLDKFEQDLEPFWRITDLKGIAEAK